MGKQKKKNLILLKQHTIPEQPSWGVLLDGNIQLVETTSYIHVIMNSPSTQIKENPTQI